MDQGKLEAKVRELFEEQGFQVSKDGDRLRAENGKAIDIAVFSSGSYSVADVESEAGNGDLIFVDEGLAEVQHRLENNVSIINDEGEDEEYSLPSYEIIGDIAVINELVDVGREEAVEGILANHSHVKTILLKEESLEGEFRVGEYEKLYGEETETVHKEFGCRFKVDPTKVYFSERFSTERNRVVSQIEDGEEVLVMFAGVGPFAVMAAKNRDPARVVAVEKNPEAVRYLKENIGLNQVSDRVEAIEGDVREAVPDLGKFDRVVMPLPGLADEFLELAVDHLREAGIVHYYRFLEGESWEEIISEVEEAAEAANRDFEIVAKTVCGHKGPGIDRVCLDVRFD